MQTHIVQQSNLRLKSQILRLHFWIQLYTKAIDPHHDSILDIKTHFKPTETFQYTHFSSSHPPGVKKGFVKGKALRLLRTNSSKTTFEENIKKLISLLLARGYPMNLIEKKLSYVKFTERSSVLRQKKKHPETNIALYDKVTPMSAQLQKIF